VRVLLCASTGSRVGWGRETGQVYRGGVAELHQESDMFQRQGAEGPPSGAVKLRAGDSFPGSLDLFIIQIVEVKESEHTLE
jgi:hypothetical protein